MGTALSLRSLRNDNAAAPLNGYSAAALTSARRFAYSANRIAATGATWPGSITSPAGGSSSAR